jgi:hypothetical protein
MDSIENNRTTIRDSVDDFIRAIQKTAHTRKPEGLNPRIHCAESIPSGFVERKHDKTRPNKTLDIIDEMP